MSIIFQDWKIANFVKLIMTKHVDTATWNQLYCLESGLIFLVQWFSQLNEQVKAFKYKVL